MPGNLTEKSKSHETEDEISVYGNQQDDAHAATYAVTGNPAYGNHRHDCFLWCEKHGPGLQSNSLLQLLMM